MTTKFASQQNFRNEDEYPLGPDEKRDFKTETYNQWAYDPVADVGLNIWFGSGQGADDRGLSNFMSTIVVFFKGRKFFARGSGGVSHARGVAGGNVFLTIDEPFKRLSIDYVGLLSTSVAAEGGDGASGDEVPVLGRMALTVEIATPPIEQGSQGDRGEVASSGTVPRTAIRYEQLCHIRGEVHIGDERVTIDALGMRSHRRNSTSIYASGAVGHSWAACLFPSGKGFHLLNYRLQPNAEPEFLYGHYFDGTRYHEGEVLRFPFYSGVTEAERSRLEMLVDGKVLAIDLVTQPPVCSTFPPEVRLTRSAVRFELDGEVGGGVLERSLTAQYSAGGGYAASGD